MATKIVTIRLEEEMVEKITRAARMSRRTRSNYVAWLISEHFRREEEEQEGKQ